MSNERVDGILKGAGVEPREAEGDFSVLTEHPTLGSEHFIRYITPLRKYLGFGPDVGGKRPSVLFFEALMASGKHGAIALVRAWETPCPMRPPPTCAGRSRRARLPSVSRGSPIWSIGVWTI